MGFETIEDYVKALKRLESFPLMGMEIKDGRWTASTIAGSAVELFFKEESEDGDD